MAFSPIRIHVCVYSDYNFLFLLLTQRFHSLYYFIMAYYNAEHHRKEEEQKLEFGRLYGIGETKNHERIQEKSRIKSRKQNDYIKSMWKIREKRIRRTQQRQ